MRSNFKHQYPYPAYIAQYINEAYSQKENPTLKGFTNFLEGLQTYVESQQDWQPFYDAACISRLSNSQLLKLKTSYIKPKGAVFIVPSFLNDDSIFDAGGDVSYIRMLLDQGYDVYSIRWNDFSTSRHIRTIKDLVENKIKPFWDKAKDDFGGTLHGLGHCLGGVLLLQTPAQFKTLTLLSTPTDFYAKGFDVADCAREWVKDRYIADPQIPPHIVQSFFARALKEESVSRIEAMAGAGHYSPVVERWINSGTPLSTQFAKDVFQTLFLRNKIRKRVEASRVMMIAPRDDVVVPSNAAILQNSKRLEPSCGHIAWLLNKSSLNDDYEQHFQFLDAI